MYGMRSEISRFFAKFDPAFLNEKRDKDNLSIVPLLSGLWEAY